MIFNSLLTVKSFYFKGMKFRGLKMMDMFVDMDCPTHDIHEIKCPTNKNDFTVF